MITSWCGQGVKTAREDVVLGGRVDGKNVWHSMTNKLYFPVDYIRRTFNTKAIPMVGSPGSPKVN